MSGPSPFDETDTTSDEGTPKKRGGVREWIRTHLVSPRSSDDEGILRTTNELIDHLGVGMGKPVDLRWLNRVHTGKNSSFEIHSDFPRFRWRIMYIAQYMIGRLRAEEWRPLIASSLFYSKGPIASARTRRTLGRVELPIS